MRTLKELYEHVWNNTPNHPWFYHVGAIPLTLTYIAKYARQSTFGGYLMEDIEKMKQSPTASQRLRELRLEVVESLKSNISVYRQCVNELRRLKKQGNHGFIDDGVHRSCNEIDSSLALKFNHLLNDFCHLQAIDDFLNLQTDLFGFEDL